MVWDETTPLDSSSYHPNVVDGIHDTKEMIRERAVVYNGTSYEHHENDDADFGVHEPSKVSWLKWHSTYADMVAFISPIENFNYSLHFVEDTEPDAEKRGLYSVFESAIKKLSPYSHAELTIDDAVEDHPQYIEKDKVDEFGEDVTYDQSDLEFNCSSLTITGDDPFVPESHTTLGFVAAHSGDDGYETPDVDDLADSSVRLKDDIDGRTSYDTWTDAYPLETSTLDSVNFTLENQFRWILRDAKDYAIFSEFAGESGRAGFSNWE